MSETFERERVMAEVKRTLENNGVAVNTTDGRHLAIQITNVAMEAYRNGFRYASAA